jgi:hypothetical protein
MNWVKLSNGTRLNLDKAVLAHPCSDGRLDIVLDNGEYTVSAADAKKVEEALSGSSAVPVAVKNRLVNLIGELLLEQNDGLIENIPGLSHAIAHIQKAVDAL